MSINKTDKFTLSVVIPTMNRRDHLKNALESLLQQSVPPKEIIVVDSSGNSETKTLVSQEHQVFFEKGISLKYIWESAKGMNYARNVGALASSGNIVLIMDDDTIVDKHYVREILKVFKNIPCAVGVQGYCLPPTAWRHNSTRVNFVNVFRSAFFLNHMEKNKQHVLPSGEVAAVYPLNKIIEASIIYATSAFKREVLLQNPLDDKLVGYSWGDEYFTLKMSQSYPHCLFVTPFAKLYHDKAPYGRPIGKPFYYITAAYELYNFDINLCPSVRNWIAFFWKWLGKAIQALTYLPSKDSRMSLIYTFESFFWAFGNLEKVRNARFNLQ
jgi:glycosyltransferase involved in cell wall biosynthesis